MADSSNKIKIACIGDSITDGYTPKLRGLFNVSKSTSGVDYKDVVIVDNFGTHGETTSEIKKRIKPGLKSFPKDGYTTTPKICNPKEYDIAIVMGGINNIANPVNEIEDDLKYIYKTLKENNCWVVALTILPARWFIKDSTTNSIKINEPKTKIANKHIQIVNEWIKRQKGNNVDKVIDTYKIFVKDNVNNNSKPDVSTIEAINENFKWELIKDEKNNNNKFQVHPKPDGYTSLVQAIFYGITGKVNELIDQRNRGNSNEEGIVPRPSGDRYGTSLSYPESLTPTPGFKFPKNGENIPPADIEDDGDRTNKDLNKKYSKSVDGPENSRLSKLYKYIKYVSEIYKKDPFFVAAIARVETTLQPNKQNNKGATGLIQVMPCTYSDMRWRKIHGRGKINSNLKELANEVGVIEDKNKIAWNIGDKGCGDDCTNPQIPDDVSEGGCLRYPIKEPVKDESNQNYGKMSLKDLLCTDIDNIDETKIKRALDYGISRIYYSIWSLKHFLKKNFGESIIEKLIPNSSRRDSILNSVTSYQTANQNGELDFWYAVTVTYNAGETAVIKAMKNAKNFNKDEFYKFNVWKNEITANGKKGNKSEPYQYAIRVIRMWKFYSEAYGGSVVIANANNELDDFVLGIGQKCIDIGKETNIHPMFLFAIAGAITDNKTWPVEIDPSELPSANLTLQ